MDLPAGSVGDPALGGATFLFPAMVLDFLVSVILRIILAMIFFELAYRVGELVLRVASFGGVRAAPIDVPPREFNWLYCRRSGDGRIEVESTIAGGIGLIISFICLALVLHFF
jgi:hypothetical protein